MKTLLFAVCMLLFLNAQSQTLTVCPTLDTVLYSYDPDWRGDIHIVGDCNFIHMEGTLWYAGPPIVIGGTWHKVMKLPFPAYPSRITYVPLYSECWQTWIFCRILLNGDVEVGQWLGAIDSNCFFIIPNGEYQHI